MSPYMGTIARMLEVLRRLLCDGVFLDPILVLMSQQLPILQLARKHVLEPRHVWVRVDKSVHTCVKMHLFLCTVECIQFSIHRLSFSINSSEFSCC